jgi:hypothetical protein
MRDLRAFGEARVLEPDVDRESHGACREVSRAGGFRF